MPIELNFINSCSFKIIASMCSIYNNKNIIYAGAYQCSQRYSLLYFDENWILLLNFKFCGLILFL